MFTPTMVPSNTLTKYTPFLRCGSTGKCRDILRRQCTDGRKKQGSSRVRMSMPMTTTCSNKYCVNNGQKPSLWQNTVPRSNILHSKRNGQFRIQSSCQLFSTSSSSSTITSPSLTARDKETIDRLATDILSRNNDNENDSDVNDGKSIGISSQNMKRRIALSKAITLVESKSHKKRLMADVLLDKLRLHSSSSSSSSSTSTHAENNTTNNNTKRPSFRLGIAGPPGVGKSTFVEALGLYILGLNEKQTNQQQQQQQQQESPSFQPSKLAVLCIDPSSHVTGGSILGDKTRMSHLSYHPRAYVRPSPSSGTLGGLGSYTYDAASLAELAGYQLTIIETVGVGQSEVELAECCDLFLLMLAPGGGDSLQGSKKGIVEVADVLVVNKADGEMEVLARRTASEYRKAMELLRKPSGWWGGRKQKGGGEEDGGGGEDSSSTNSCDAPDAPPVLLVSAQTGVGIPELWKTIVDYQQYAKSSGHHTEKRRLQNRYWMWKYLRERVLEAARKNSSVKRRAEEIQNSLDCGLIAPRVAAGELWKHIVGSADSEDG